MTTPFSHNIEDITAADFSRFYVLFSQTVYAYLPCSGVVFFPVSVDGAISESGAMGGGEDWQAVVDQVQGTEQAIYHDQDKRLFMPLWNQTDLVAVAVLSGCSADIVSKDKEWVAERGYFISRELFIIKKGSVDLQSGLLNLHHLHEEINVWLHAGQEGAVEHHLLLVEICTKAQHADQKISNIACHGAYLDSLIGDYASVHHLGAEVFALLWGSGDQGEIQKLAYSVLGKLKRQRCGMVHIGIAGLTCDNAEQGAGIEDCDFACNIISQAWQALRLARQRGPFALCFADFAGSAMDSLALPLPETLEFYKKKWRRQPIFTMALVKKDIRSDAFPERVMSLLGKGARLVDGEDDACYVFLPGMDEDEGQLWAESLQGKIDEIGAGSFSIGLAGYPCPGFKKADVVQNAQKALLHASFLGHGAITVFNGVSLNISGDALYNDGDLLGAIKEYLLGLNLDPQNSNLLNSLGVVYAQIDQYGKAIPLFERAIASDDHDFMALYNLGSAHLQRSSTELAQKYFEKALAVDDSYFELLLQLGQIYCARRQFKKALKLLLKAEQTARSHTKADDGKPWERCEPWHDVSTLGHGLLYRPLAEAYIGLGENRAAMAALERATRYNERDDRALSMLGELYVIEQQGSDIAVSLCRRAVELDGANGDNWCSLAQALFSDGAFADSQQALKECLRLSPKNAEALMLLARVYEKLGKLKLAAETYDRILKFDGTNKKAVKFLKKIHKTG